MSARKSMINIRLQNGDIVFLISEYEPHNKLLLKIVHSNGTEAFEGEMNDIDLRMQAASIRLPFDDFIQKMIQALFENAFQSSTFIYCLDEKHNETATFKWKSVDEEETIINLGCVEMSRKDYFFIFVEGLQSISEEMNRLSSELQNLTRELADSKQQASDALKQLSVATNMKETFEKEMYSKFVLVLNEKKRKIRELQAGKSEPKVGNDHHQKKKARKTRELIFSDSSDDADGNIDINEPGPSTANKRNSLMFLDDNKPIVPITNNSIRNRKVATPKKQNGGIGMEFKIANLSNGNETIRNLSNGNETIRKDNESVESLLNIF